MYSLWLQKSLMGVVALLMVAKICDRGLLLFNTKTFHCKFFFALKCLSLVWIREYLTVFWYLLISWWTEYYHRIYFYQHYIYELFTAYRISYKRELVLTPIIIDELFLSAFPRKKYNIDMERETWRCFKEILYFCLIMHTVDKVHYHHLMIREVFVLTYL